MSDGVPDSLTDLASRLLVFVFAGGILEVLGMLLYMQWADPVALETLTSGGITVGELVAFLLASPDRILVAVGLAAVAALMAWINDTSARTHTDGT